MKTKCEYCGGYISDTDETCPNCGAVNPLLVRKIKKVPSTIVELKQWYNKKDFPPSKVTRFFIGENPGFKNSSGIYKSKKTGNTVLYEIDSKGNRIIRYDGKDEAYAVNEFYMQIRETMAQRKEAQLRLSNLPDAPDFNGQNDEELIEPEDYDEVDTGNYIEYKIEVKSSSYSNGFENEEEIRKKAFERMANITESRMKIEHRKRLKYKEEDRKFGFIIAIIVIIFGIFILIVTKLQEPKRGYYYYNGSYYYYQNNEWYEYIQYVGWCEVNAPVLLKGNDDNYYKSKVYSYEYNIEKFKKTD